jgi:hypothetical protein
VSTRAVVHFVSAVMTQGDGMGIWTPTDEFRIHASVHKWHNGGPEVMAEMLAHFIGEVQQQAGSARFTEPDLLAARFVVFASQVDAPDDASPLAFTGLGVWTSEPGDIEYRWYLDCTYRPGVLLPRLGGSVVVDDPDTFRTMPGPGRFSQISWR